MLNKLLKYDLKRIYKVVIVFYLLALSFAITGRLVGICNDESFACLMISGFIKGFSIGMIISALINNLMRGWVSFNQNVYGDESYLTHTLPVTKNQIFFSKILSGIITLLTTFIVAIICIVIMYYTKNNIELLNNYLVSLSTALNIKSIVIIISVILVFFLEVLFMYLSGCVGLVKGHQKNDNKMLHSIIIGIVIYLGMQVITLLIIFIIGLFNKDIMLLFTSNTLTNIDTLKITMVTGIIIYIIYN